MEELNYGKFYYVLNAPLMPAKRSDVEIKLVLTLNWKRQLKWTNTPFMSTYHVIRAIIKF